MRLIDADRVTENLQIFVDWCRDGRRQGAEFCLDCVIPNTPTVDAVPVIKCKDCKWHDIKTFRELTLHRCYLNPDDVETCPDGFCAWAERKEE